jgi:hypothetical protein
MTLRQDCEAWLDEWYARLRERNIVSMRDRGVSDEEIEWFLRESDAFNARHRAETLDRMVRTIEHPDALCWTAH